MQWSPAIQKIHFRGLTGPVVHSLMTMEELKRFCDMVQKEKEQGVGDMEATFSRVCEERYTTPEEHAYFSQRLAKLMKRVHALGYLSYEDARLTVATP